jgi:2-polyprenyl-6-methoxyphenol hydroxylase-like FAD-dependent oxidoreductase
MCNIVWYHNVDKDDLPKVLTDYSGHTHKFSLGLGKIRPEVRDAQRKTSAQFLTKPMNEIFQKIENPFIQAITDSLATKTVFMSGKVILVGDAVAGLRPHTTAGLSQGAMHALLLKKVFDKEASMSLEEWETGIMEWATAAAKLGVDFGELSQFGDHPQAE